MSELGPVQAHDPVPFRIEVPQAVLDDLRGRLARTRWPDAVHGAGWERGADPAYMRELIAYWADGFDWRAREAELNRFAHFRARVEGLNLHFIHEHGRGSSPVPILVLHGWPGSFVQMRRFVPLLADPAAHGGESADSFSVVAASLPGFGFSDAAAEPGMGVARIGELLHTLMTERLGYRRYAVRGSDLGAGVASQMAVAHPDAVIGLHTGGTNPWVQGAPADLSPAEREFVANAERWQREEMAYAMLHSTRPQTPAYALNDSPAGLAAWIVEKIHRWTDHDGNLEQAIPRDDLLANLTVYWATGTIGSSMRLYYETAHNPGAWGRAEVPTAFAMPPRDLFPTPRAWVERTSRVDRWTELPRGGHFPEWEVPEALAEDVRAFYRALR